MKGDIIARRELAAVSFAAAQKLQREWQERADRKSREAAWISRIHPAIFELIKLLPKRPDEGATAEWPIPERVKWMRAIAAVFDLIYVDDGEIPPLIQFSVKSVASNGHLPTP